MCIRDRYTSQPEYWQEVEELVGSAPSTLRLILPESCLDGPSVETDIMEVNNTMTRYLREERFCTLPASLIYVERRLDNLRLRRGLVGMVDLEQYDYEPGAEAQVRATEGTVMARIPPRVAVRKNAPLELPHVMPVAYTHLDVYKRQGHGDAAADAAQAHGQGSAYVLEALGDTASRRGGLRRAGGGGAAADAHHAGQYQEGEEGGDVGSKGPLGPASGVLADADEEQGGENREGGKEQDNEFQHGDYLLRITRLCGQHSRFFSGQRGCRRRRRSGRRARCV